MDYETIYKRSIELAKYFVECGHLSQSDAEEMFPELSESEDERIRKFLKDYAIEMIAGLESDISISVYDGVKGHDPEAEAELEEWKGIRAWLEKQKPAEWSEEDERMLKAIIGGLGCIQKAGCERFGGEEMSDVCLWIKNRFKSLCPQPHWKPSEEQMCELNWASKLSPVLESLYNDLKKKC